MSKHVRVSRPGSNPAREADLRIQKAIECLSSSERGRAVLDDLALIFNGPARNLDLDGMANLVCLVREFAMGGRRDFVPVKEPSEPKKRTEACRYCGEVDCPHPSDCPKRLEDMERDAKEGL